MPCGGFGERVVNTMAESKNYIVQPQEGGNILISEDVIASIASLAVREVEGVYGLRSNGDPRQEEPEQRHPRDAAGQRH